MKKDSKLWLIIRIDRRDPYIGGSEERRWSLHQEMNELGLVRDHLVSVLVVMFYQYKFFSLT